jgi:hypothetical protein
MDKETDMPLSSLLAALFGAALLTNCSGLVPTIGEQSDVQRLLVSDPLPVAFRKVRNETMAEGVLVTHEDVQAGTLQGTAYSQQVSIFFLLKAVNGTQTQIDAIARTNPGTFSHGRLDLAARILERYPREGR